MSLFKLFTITSLSLLLWTCGNSDSEKNKFSITTNADKNTLQLGQSLKASLQNPKNLEVQSVTYTFDGKEVSESFVVDSKLGENTLVAKVQYEDGSEEVSTKIIVLNNEAPKIYSYKIVNEYPHDIKSYTQGLEFHNSELYESTGQYGESKLRKVDYKSGEVLKKCQFSKSIFWRRHHHYER